MTSPPVLLFVSFVIFVSLAPLILAWFPFRDPMPLHHHWLWLLPPLVLAIAIVYRALKSPTLDRLALESARRSAYVIALMALAASKTWNSWWASPDATVA